MTSPGSIPASIYAYDSQGLDRLVVSVRSDSGTFQGDSTYLFAGTNEQTMNVLWTVPVGIPFQSRITLIAKAKNLIGFTATDSVILTVQR